MPYVLSGTLEISVYPRFSKVWHKFGAQSSTVLSSSLCGQPFLVPHSGTSYQLVSQTDYGSRAFFALFVLEPSASESA